MRKHGSGLQTMTQPRRSKDACKASGAGDGIGETAARDFMRVGLTVAVRDMRQAVAERGAQHRRTITGSMRSADKMWTAFDASDRAW